MKKSKINKIKNISDWKISRNYDYNSYLNLAFIFCEMPINVLLKCC